MTTHTEELDLRPESFQQMQKTGVPGHQDLTLKPGRYKLGLGVMDYGSSKIGIMEVPVTARPPQTASK